MKMTTNFGTKADGVTTVTDARLHDESILA